MPGPITNTILGLWPSDQPPLWLVPAPIIHVPIGTDCRVRLVVRQFDQGPQDLSGFQSLILSAGPGILSRAGTVVNPGAGLVDFDIIQADTIGKEPNSYPADIFGVDAAGVRERVTPLGSYVIEPVVGLITAPIDSFLSVLASGVVAFDDESEKQATFRYPIGTTDVIVQLTPVVAGDAGVPFLGAANITQTGLLIIASGPFTGEVTYVVVPNFP
jgi:hypothetical protein